MSQPAVELIVAAFGDEQGAENAVKTLEEAKKERGLGLYDSAVIRRDADNILHIRETWGGGAGKGVATSALIGGVIGLLFPPEVLAPGLIGSTVGGLATRLKEDGFSDKAIKELGTSLKPGTSAIIAIVDHQGADDLEHQIEMQGASIVRQFISTDIAAQLEPDVRAPDSIQHPARIAQAAQTAAAVESAPGTLHIHDSSTEIENVAPNAGLTLDQHVNPTAPESNPEMDRLHDGSSDTADDVKDAASH
jgi:uncharacterized membrane protein